MPCIATGGIKVPVAMIVGPFVCVGVAAGNRG